LNNHDHGVAARAIIDYMIEMPKPELEIFIQNAPNMKSLEFNQSFNSIFLGSQPLSADDGIAQFKKLFLKP